jgi:hypothetical protein
MIANVGKLAAHFAEGSVSPLNMSYDSVAPSTAHGVDALFASMERKVGLENNI